MVSTKTRKTRSISMACGKRILSPVGFYLALFVKTLIFEADLSMRKNFVSVTRKIVYEREIQF